MTLFVGNLYRHVATKRLYKTELTQIQMTKLGSWRNGASCESFWNTPKKGNPTDVQKVMLNITWIQLPCRLKTLKKIQQKSLVLQFSFKLVILTSFHRFCTNPLRIPLVLLPLAHTRKRITDYTVTFEQTNLQYLFAQIDKYWQINFMFLITSNRLIAE